MTEIMNIQWFPGHMAKTKKIIEKNLKLVDIVIELLDSRAPKSSENPELKNIIKNKKRITLLNKSDLADKIITDKWISYYNENRLNVITIDSKSNKSINKVILEIKNILKGKVITRPIRGMVVGIPNVGKSSFINGVAHGKKAKVEDRPGVTKGKQWINSSFGIDLLDVPGILWPKFNDKNVGEKLAFLGSVKDDILDVEQLAARLLERLVVSYKQLITQRYKIDSEINDGYSLLRHIGKKRGMVISGGQIDLQRAGIMVLDEFRAGKIGKISLEEPDDFN